MNKKTYIFLIVATLCVIGVSAKTIHLWRNGTKTDLPIQTNDSITFDAGNTPTMHIWRDGSEIYQLALAVDDSITYSQDGICFDYNHWREQTTIAIYHSQNKFDTIALPWASVATTSIPMEYKHPEKDTLPNGSFKWQLAFNFCDSTTIPGVDMFGLWDQGGQIMRVYAYLEQLPNPQAKSCFYQVTSSAPAFMSADTRGFMPSSATIGSCDWSTAMPGRIPQPTTTYCELLPITGTLDGEVLPGWICFEISFAFGLFDLPKDATITFAMLGIEDIDFTGEAIISGKLESYGGKITVPGNKAKQTGGIMSAVGDGVAKICDFVMGGMQLNNTGGWIAAGIGIAGTAVSAAGNVVTANQEGKDVTYSLDLNFNVSDSAQINGSLTSHLPTTIAPVQITYERFFEQILKQDNHHMYGPYLAPGKHAPKGVDDVLRLGLWNLEAPPVIYVCTDAVFVDRDGRSVLISFLDPGSIKVNTNTAYDVDWAYYMKNIDITAYDFVFTDPNYTLPADPYLNFYGIHRDLNTFSFPECKYSNNDPVQYIFYSSGYSETEGWQRFSNDYNMNFEDQTFALVDTAHCYKPTITRGGIEYTYYGVAPISQGDAITGSHVVCNPAIATYDYTFDLTQLYVGVAVEIEYSTGEKRFFADRYLPEIRVFKRADAQALYDKIDKEWFHDCSELIDPNVPLFDAQKDKAKRLLEPLMYYIGYVK